MRTFDDYVGKLVAHGRLDLHIEMKEAMRMVSDFGGFSILTEALGIPRPAIVESGGLGIMKIRTAGRYFTPAAAPTGAPGGIAETALIVPVWQPDLGGDLVDLLALRLDHRALFFVRTGAARCLGMAFADDARDRTPLWCLRGDAHPSLNLFPNSLVWLRGNCRGAVLLHEAWVVHTLTGIKSVTAHSERHAASC